MDKYINDKNSRKEKSLDVTISQCYTIYRSEIHSSAK